MARRYRNFADYADYIEYNYKERIYNSLIDYIEEYELTGKGYSDEVYINNYRVNSIHVKYVKFTKSEIENVEFTINIEANYELLETEDEQLIKRYPTKKSFLYRMSGSFNDGF